VSAKRTAVELVASDAIAGAETLDLTLHPPLLGLQAGELGVVVGQRSQITSPARQAARG
jgi:hypothetical protein